MHIPPQLTKLPEAVSAFAADVVSRSRHSWKLLAGIAVALVVFSSGLMIYALQERSYGPAPASPSDDAATSTANLLERALDGVLVDASSTRLLPIAVMVENSADAWPLQGPAKANLVYEAPVEGSITRLMLVFDATSTVDEIGPVRSARPYFVDWADGLDAFYVHVGGSPDALTKITSIAGFRDLNEFWNGWAFWRSAHRIAPHNVLTRTELLLQAAERKEFTPGSFTPWQYADVPTSTPAATSTRTIEQERIRVPYDGIYAAEWRYDAERDDYVRYRGNTIVRDADGAIVRTKNAVVILTDGNVLDDLGRLRIRTTGRGKAWVFSSGNKREATWSRTAGEHIRFETVDGADVIFQRGTTWISVVTGAGAFDSVTN